MIKFDYTRYYSRWHPDTTAHHQQMRLTMARRLRPFLPDSKNIRILDVGCGTGFAVGAMRDAGYSNVIGIDSDTGQVKTAERHSLPVVHVAVEDTLGWLGKHAASFDLVLCLDVIEHVPLGVQVEFVSAIKETLCAGGLFVCSVPNANSSLASRWRYGDYTHCTSFTEDSLDFLLFHAGFTQIVIAADEERPRFPWVLRPQLRWWYVRQFFRSLRRLQLMAELGSVRGSRAPVSLNLIATARVGESENGSAASSKQLMR
jgi:SAM-dependent methyltransferase